MNSPRTVALILGLATWSCSSSSGSGDSGAVPGWQARTVLALTNSVRISPAQWRASWGSSLPSTILSEAVYPSVAPLRWNSALGMSASQHSAELTASGCEFQHDSCDGTSWSARISSFYTLSSAIGENIAAGYGDPLAVMIGWICDEKDSVCCVDDGGCDGHRANIMSSGYQALGVGWAEGGSYGQYWTQDFGGVADGTEQALVDGSHLFRSTGKTTFFANYYGDAAPRSVTVILAGEEQAMSLAFGTSARGTWSVDVTKGSACRSYHFLAVDGDGATLRYPESGELVTYGEGECTTSAE